MHARTPQMRDASHGYVQYEGGSRTTRLATRGRVARANCLTTGVQPGAWE